MLKAYVSVGVNVVTGSHDTQTVVSDAVGHNQVEMFKKLLTRRVVVCLQILHTVSKKMEIICVHHK